MGEEVNMTLCGLCVWHCPMEVRLNDGRVVGVESKGFKGCPRSLTSPELLYHPQRLNYPLKRAGDRGEGKFERMAWDEAFLQGKGDLTRESGK